MATISTSLIHTAEAALLHEIKARLKANLVEKLVDDFRVQAEEAVKQEVEKLSLKGIERFRDMMHLRDEFHVYCHWSGEQNKLTR